MIGLFCHAKGDEFAHLMFNSFKEGFQKHGDDIQWVKSHINKDKLKFHSADFCIIIGYNIVSDFRRRCIQLAKLNKMPIVYVDAGFTNRKTLYNIQSYGDPWHYLAIGLNGIKGLGNYNIEDITELDIDRWESISKNCNLELKEWKREGDYILVAGHNMFGLSNFYTPARRQELNINKMVKALRDKYKMDVIYRCHPSLQKINRRAYEKLTRKTSLQYDLSNALFSVGWHTNALVHSIINGVPAIYLDKYSFLDETVASKSIDGPISYPDRTLWLNKLSYSQWNYEEIKSGEGLVRIKGLIDAYIS